MLSAVVNMIDQVSHSLMAASNVLVFLGGGYVALHSRIMPKWLVTCLWYLGLAALLNLLTFVVEWGAGQLHPLSHFQIGAVTETLIHMTLAATVCLLFFNTVWKDYLGSKARREEVKKTSVRPRIKTAVKRTTTKLANKLPTKKAVTKEISPKRAAMRKTSQRYGNLNKPLEF